MTRNLTRGGAGKKWPLFGVYGGGINSINRHLRTSL